MITSARRAAWAGVALSLCLITFWSVSKGEPRLSTRPLPTSEATTQHVDPPQETTTPGEEEPAPSTGTDTQNTVVEGPRKTRAYALGLHELRGLPPTISTGTSFELWATWEPPIVDEPTAGLLIPKVTVVEVIPPIAPEGPTSVILSIPLKYMSDFTYAHRWGTFSVALL